MSQILTDCSVASFLINHVAMILLLLLPLVYLFCLSDDFWWLQKKDELSSLQLT